MILYSVEHLRFKGLFQEHKTFFITTCPRNLSKCQQIFIYPIALFLQLHVAPRPTPAAIQEAFVYSLFSTPVPHINLSLFAPSRSLPLLSPFWTQLLWKWEEGFTLSFLNWIKLWFFWGKPPPPFPKWLWKSFERQCSFTKWLIALTTCREHYWRSWIWKGSSKGNKALGTKGKMLDAGNWERNQLDE